MIIMKHTSPSPLHCRGFTLVELLVVISIIAILASVGFSVYQKAIENTRKTSATVCMNGLIQACDAFYEEFTRLPMAQTAAIDAEQVTDNQFMSPLLGLPIAQIENPINRVFFEFKNAKGKGEAAFDGLERTENRAELLGPWDNPTKSDRYYRVMLNYDYDNQLREPQAVGNEILWDRRAVAYHMGKDGKVGGEYDQDNVYSWSKSR